MTAGALEPYAPARPMLRPAPPLEPPYDDELAPVLAFTARADGDTLPFEEAAGQGDAGADEFGARPTPRCQLTDPQPWAVRLVQATLEVLAGQRPIQQLMPWTDERVYGQVGRMLRRRQPRPARLRSVHVSEPTEGVAEVCAVIRRGDRVHALAARLEGVDGRWRCTALQFG